ncbi:MAG: hypothetical protein IPM35_14475 [Myxococcales bacterium]|nr:hypothetical protein [Myxococcales bacterium]
MTGAVFLTERAELARLDAHFVRVLRDLHAHPPPRLATGGATAGAAGSSAGIDGSTNVPREPSDDACSCRFLGHTEAGAEAAIAVTAAAILLHGARRRARQG